MPEIVIRHAHIDDCPALAQILITTTRYTFRGRVPDPCLDWLTPEESAANWAKNFQTDQTLNSENYLFVAESKASGVIGFAMLCLLKPQIDHYQYIDKQYSHELRSLQILPTWQQQGIGKQLISEVAGRVVKNGSKRLLVKMIVDNPNLGIYEHLGAIKLGTSPFVWEGYETKEIIYGWDNLDRLRNVT